MCDGQDDFRAGRRFTPMGEGGSGEGLCNRNHLHFGRLNIETVITVLCRWVSLKELDGGLFH